MAHAREGCVENVIGELEANGRADADLGGHEEGDPEGQHRGHEVHEGRLPVVVEDLGGGEDGPDGEDDDGRERSFGDPEQGRTELEDGEDYETTCDEAVGRRSHPCG